jgi:hypothetical protein
VISIKIGSGEKNEEEREREWLMFLWTIKLSSEQFFVQTLSFSRDTLITHTHSALIARMNQVITSQSKTNAVAHYAFSKALKERRHRTTTASSSSSSSSPTEAQAQRTKTKTSTTFSRRELAASSMMMIAATSTVFTRRLALADEDDDMSQEELDEYVKSVTAKNSGEVTYIDVDAEVEDSSLSSTFKMSSLWKLGSKSKSVGGGDSSSYPDATFDGLLDPVNGTVAQRVFFTKTENVDVDSVEELGKPENLQVYKQLYLEGVNDTFKRSDMLGASSRIDSNGITYYEYELVASPPPKSCPSAVGCLYPEHIYLISSCVKDKKMFVMVIDATPELWRQSGASLKKLRSTFNVMAKQSETQSSLSEA